MRGTNCNRNKILPCNFHLLQSFPFFSFLFYSFFTNCRIFILLLFCSSNYLFLNTYTLRWVYMKNVGEKINSRPIIKVTELMRMITKVYIFKRIAEQLGMIVDSCGMKNKLKIFTTTAIVVSDLMETLSWSYSKIFMFTYKTFTDCEIFNCESIFITYT